MSLEETAALLKTTVGAVKSRCIAADRPTEQRGSAGDEPLCADARPGRKIHNGNGGKNDLAALQALCLSDLNVELVGGAEMEGFDKARPFFGHAHFVMPEWGLAPIRIGASSNMAANRWCSVSHTRRHGRHQRSPSARRRATAKLRASAVVLLSRTRSAPSASARFAGAETARYRSPP